MGCTTSTQRPSRSRQYHPQSRSRTHQQRAVAVSARPIAALSAKYCSHHVTTLHLREKVFSLSGDDFTIRDLQSGQVKFRVDGSAFSLRDRKTLLDARNQTVAVMRNELVSFLPTFHVSGAGVAFTVKAKLAFSTVLECQFRNVATGESCRLSVDGDWRARSAVLRVESSVRRFAIARVYRPTATARNLVLGKQDYAVETAPNVDSALVALVCLALDESRRD